MGKWEMVRLGDVCEKDSSNIAQKDLENNFGDYPIYGAAGLIKYVDFYKQLDEYIAIVKDGAGIGRTILMPAKSSVIGTMQYILPTKAIDTKYLFFAITHMNLAKYFTGATIPHIYFKDYCKEQLPLPPLDEQKRIAKNLDLASEIVKGYKEQLAELDKLVQSVFCEMFGDPVTNEKGWDSKPLSKTTQIVTGNTPPRNCKDNYGHCIEWIKTDNITDALYVTQASEYLSERGAEIGRLVDADAILMACIAGSIKSIGRVAIANRKVAFNQQINAVIANEYDTLFLYWLFRMTQRYIQSTINMSLKGILSKGKLEKLVFIAPPLPLQAHFSSIVTEIESQKAQIQQALTEAENLFNSLMQEYFE